MKTFISVAEAREIIFAAASRRDTEKLFATDASGMTLSEDVFSATDLPAFTNSAMDGYAVRAADIVVGKPVRVVGEIRAGEESTIDADTGECTRIMTGAPLPEWADSVIPIEWVEAKSPDQQIVPTRLIERGKNVRVAGEDLAEGAVLLGEGELLGVIEQGMLAYGGVSTVSVVKPPTVAVITTGDELIAPGTPLRRGQVYNSNAPTLEAGILDAGGLPLKSLHARDNKEDIAEATNKAAAADIVVFSGGVSVGKYDYVKEVLDDLGFDMMFWKVRQRPGKPLAFGMLDEALVFGLPGNPVSSSVCFDQYVRPAIARMLGRSRPDRKQQNAKLVGSIEKSPELHYFARGKSFTDDDATMSVRILKSQASNIFSSLHEANCLVHLPEGVPRLEDGTIVAIEHL